MATVQIHFDAEKAGDWEKIKNMYADDIVWERSWVNQIVEGKEVVAAAYVELFSGLRDYDFNSHDRFTTENRVVDDSIFTFEAAKEGIMPLPVGTKGILRLVHIFQMREDKVSKELVIGISSPAHFRIAWHRQIDEPIVTFSLTSSLSECICP